MIIWLASYPKSGNTWLRTIIGQILTNNFESEKVFENSKSIRLYPSKIDFIDLDDDFKQSILTEEKKKIILNKTAQYWEISQSTINLNNKTNIFKTHNMLCKLEIDKKLYSFTSLENTMGVIHIVRDPRNVISSLINHFSLNSEETAIKFILNENQTIGINENQIPQLLSSWKNHYKSWKRFPKNNHLVRYEDLILNPKDEILRLIKFLKKFLNFSISNNDIDKIILNSSFQNLKNLENKGFFNENAKNYSSGKLQNFFHLGEKNNWKELIKSNTAHDLVRNFQDEMKELKYI